MIWRSPLTQRSRHSESVATRSSVSVPSSKTREKQLSSLSEGRFSCSLRRVRALMSLKRSDFQPTRTSPISLISTNQTTLVSRKFALFIRQISGKGISLFVYLRPTCLARCIARCTETHISYTACKLSRA